MHKLIIVSCVLLILACRNDKKESSASVTELNTEVAQDLVDNNYLYTKSRFRLRSDSSLIGNTVLTMDEGDTIQYLQQSSVTRTVIKLGGKYRYQPWLKVLHLKSGKEGWVYASGVDYESADLKETIRAAGRYWEEINADDLEWEGTVPTGWGTATIRDASDFKKFLIKFKRSVANEDVDAIANLIRFPIKEINSKSEFKNNFSRIFTPELKQVINAQRLDRIFRNDQGAMLGNGDVWFQQIGKDYKIIRLNFKGREDLIEELMVHLRRTYLESGGNKKIMAFPIRGFLEMRMEHSSFIGGDKSSPLGKYSFISSKEGTHIFEREGSQGTRKAIFYMEADSSVTLRILDADENFELNSIEFTG